MQTPEETLAQRQRLVPRLRLAAGQLLRHLGLAARFVSGYLIQLDARRQGARRPVGHRPTTSPTCTPGPRSTCPAPAGSASTRPRACSPAKGTSRSRARRSRESAAPISGAVDECEVEFSHHDGGAARLRGAARHQAVHRGRSGRAIDRARRSEVDAALRRGDVRLTMGGEPTFVSIDDLDGAEWNTAALGPRKRQLAGALLRRLQAPLRRRAACCTTARASGIPASRCRAGRSAATGARDGEPIWHDDTLIADEATRLRRTARPTAQRFIAGAGARARRRADCARARLRGRLVLPVAGAAAAGQRRSAERAARRRGRARAARAASSSSGLEHGRRLRAAAGAPRRSGRARRLALAQRPWFFRAEHLFLIPGDSPMGYRLPLDSLPWVAEADRETLVEPDPFEARPPLPRARPATDAGRRRRCTGAAPRGAGAGRAADARAARRRARPAAAARRVGRRHRPHRAVRRAARRPPARLPAAGAHRRGLPRAGRRRSKRRRPRCGMPVILEGYPPPHDPRLTHVKVTPDPGVIEVNVQPARELGRAGRAHHDALRGGAADAPRHREVHARRPAHRHRRRQPRRARRRDARPTARSCAGPTCCAAWSPTGTTIRRCPTCSPACSSARPARPRASTRRATTASTSWRSRSRQMPRPAQRRRRRGWSIASSATCWSTSPATRTAPSSASTSCTRPTAPAAGRGCSSCAPSRCRRTRG